jgi:hypothetical protein
MMPLTTIKTQLTGWLKNAPIRERRHAEGMAGSAGSVICGTDTVGFR